MKISTERVNSMAKLIFKIRIKEIIHAKYYGWYCRIWQLFARIVWLPDLAICPDCTCHTSIAYHSCIVAMATTTVYIHCFIFWSLLPFWNWRKIINTKSYGSFENNYYIWTLFQLLQPLPRIPHHAISLRVLWDVEEQPKVLLLDIKVWHILVNIILYNKLLYAGSGYQFVPF